MKLIQSSIFRALCALAVGVLILKFPQDGVTWLTMAIGALFLLSGVIALIAYWQSRKRAGEYTITDREGRVVSGSQPTFPVVGAGSLIFGLTLVVTPGVFVNGLMYVIGIVVILGGVTQLMSLIAARRLGSVPFGFWICPSIVMLTGLFVLLKPMETAELPLVILGWCSLLYGVTEILNSLKIWSLRKQADAAPQRHDGETIAVEISSETNPPSHVGDDTLDVGLEDVDAGTVVASPGDN